MRFPVEQHALDGWQLRYNPYSSVHKTGIQCEPVRRRTQRACEFSASAYSWRNMSAMVSGNTLAQVKAGRLRYRNHNQAAPAGP